MIDHLKSIIECAKAQNAAYVNMPIGTLEIIARRIKADSDKISELRRYIPLAYAHVGSPCGEVFENKTELALSRLPNAKDHRAEGSGASSC